MICSVSGCDRPSRAKGLCNKHYLRQRKYGDPLITAWEKNDPQANFWAKVDKTEGCWNWTGYRDRDGYGHFGVWIDGRQDDMPAHRWAYEDLIGPIPNGLQIDHLCRNKACVNPAHLEPVTLAVNVARAPRIRGADHPNAKKTHCPNGHPYDEVNTVSHPNGDGYTSRYCVTCRRATARKASAKYRAKRKT